MSRVYFHSPSGTTELLGAERAYAGGLATDLALAFLPHFRLEDAVRSIVPTDSYIWSARPAQFAESFRAWWSVGEHGLTLPQPYGLMEPFEVSLNTAITLGGRPLKLLARIHGQCEIHCYVEGPNRQWLAGIIFEGRGLGVLRSGMGWEDVATLLTSRDDEPVVMSYSVCEQFPNAFVAGWNPAIDPAWIPDWAHDGQGAAEWAAMSSEDQEDSRRGYAGDLWYEVPVDQQWEMAIGALRASRSGLELRPDNFDAYHFGSGLKMWDVLEIARELQPAESP